MSSLVGHVVDHVSAATDLRRVIIESSTQVLAFEGRLEITNNFIDADRWRFFYYISFSYFFYYVYCLRVIVNKRGYDCASEYWFVARFKVKLLFVW